MSPAHRIAVPPHWQWHYRVLSRLRDSLVRERDEREAALREPVPRGGEDICDVAHEQSEHAELLEQLRGEEEEFAEVEAALARIHDGTYGICEATGDPIAAERLRAIPWTRFTGEAAARLEKTKAFLRG
jgi:RNA polymerase-binding transcription factor DksA